MTTLAGYERSRFGEGRPPYLLGHSNGANGSAGKVANGRYVEKCWSAVRRSERNVGTDLQANHATPSTGSATLPRTSRGGLTTLTP